MSAAIAPSHGSPLDPFLPHADVRERHEILVHAPADLVLATARHLDPESIPAVRAIFSLRAWILGSRRPRLAAGLVEKTLRLGWGILEEEEGRFFCAGAVCRPWLADVDFRPLPPADFAAYAEPGRVKIAWTLEAVPEKAGWTRFATETRATATGRGLPGEVSPLLGIRRPRHHVDSKALAAGRAAGSRAAGESRGFVILIRLHHSSRTPSDGYCSS